MRRNAKTFFCMGMTLVSAISFSSFAYSSTQLNIRDNEADAGDVIVLPEGAELDVAVNENGITLTLPNIDLRLRCLGEPTAEGYCLLEAGTTGGGGGSGGNVQDSDGDGVPDSNDLCFTTPAGSFVNSNGCSNDQLGGGSGSGGGSGGGSQPVDGDNDGEPDNTDNCPSVANASQADADNDGTGDACDSTPNGSGGGGGTQPNTSTYCSNAQASNVSCSANQNIDTWYVGSGEIDLSVPRNKILSVPFTTRASSTDSITLVYTTDIGPLQTSQYAWRTWVSQYPGGDPLNSNTCYTAGSQARTNMTITQKAGDPGCKIATSKATWYINYVVSGAAGYYPGTYKFDIQKSSN